MTVLDEIVQDQLRTDLPELATGDTVKVSAKVVSQGRDEKIMIIKFRRRKHYRRTQGHRQAFTEVEITSISGA